MDYTREQLIDALTNEWRLLCLEEYDEEDDTPEEYLIYLNALSYDELVYETGDEGDLTVFMEQYSL